MSKEEVKKYWLEMYQKDKIGTIAKLSQAMQHMAWLREWKRVHGYQSRIKPITKKVDGKKVKVGEANIAVAWSELDEFFRTGNEYGDIETVKFLTERIERGDTSPLTEQELYDLSERENVKWSDGKHSLNPFQGYLYDFTANNSFILKLAEQKGEYGKFGPIRDYENFGCPQDLENSNERTNEAYKSFKRYYTTRLVQELVKILGRKSDYYEFVYFDITSVKTPEQIEKLDQKLAKIIQSPEIQTALEVINGNEEYEKAFYDKLRKEIEIEIKKDSDRIENAQKVYVALETGNLDEILEDDETGKWATKLYEEDRYKKEKEDEKKKREVRSRNFAKLIEYLIKSDDPRLDEMCWISGGKSGVGYRCHNGPISVRTAILSEMTNNPITMQYYRLAEDHEHHVGFWHKIIPVKDLSIEQKMLINIERKKREEQRKTNLEKTKKSKLDRVGVATFALHGYIPEWALEYIPELEGYPLYTGDDFRRCYDADPVDIAITERERIEKELTGLFTRDLSLRKMKGLGVIGVEEIAKISQETGITTTEVGGAKSFVTKLLNKIRGIGEK